MTHFKLYNIYHIFGEPGPDDDNEQIKFQILVDPQTRPD